MLEEQTYEQVSQEVGVSKATLNQWRKRYEKHGLKGLERKKRSQEPPDKEREQAIVEARREGQTLKEIGEQFGITRERVRQIIINSGEDTPDFKRGKRPGGGYKSKFPKKTIDKAVRLYEDGESVKDICDEIGVSANTLRIWLRKNGIDERRRPDYDEETQRAAMEMYKTHPAKDVAEKFDVNIGTLTVWARKFGISKARRFPEEVMKAAVKMYETHPAEEVAEVFGCSVGTIHLWKTKYGDGSKKSKTGRPVFSDDERKAMAKMAKKAPISEVAAKFGASGSTVRRAVKEYQSA